MHSFKYFICDVSVCGSCCMSPRAAASTGLCSAGTERDTARPHNATVLARQLPVPALGHGLEEAFPGWYLVAWFGFFQCWLW